MRLAKWDSVLSSGWLSTGSSFLKAWPWRSLGRKQEASLSRLVLGTGNRRGRRSVGHPFSAVVIRGRRRVGKLQAGVKRGCER